jgi:hypothetical protein
MPTMLATRYKAGMTKAEFTAGLKSVFTMSNYYLGKYKYETAGSKLASQYYGEYYDAKPELCDQIERELGI